jgi:subtilisin family serine protease
MFSRFSRRRLTIAVTLATVVGSLAGAGAGAGPAAFADPKGAALVTDAAVAPGSIMYADAAKAIPDNYIVVLKTSSGDTERVARELAAKYQATLTFTYKTALQGFAAKVSADRARLIAGEPTVEYVAQDQEVSLDYFVQPGPPSWGIDRIDEHSLPLDNKYHFPSGANTARAFIIDTGILLNHQEYAGRAFCGFDPWGMGCAPCNQFHGSHVAGTVGGRSVGVAKQVQIISVRVFECSPFTTWAIVIAGVDYVTLAQTITPTARSVANMSLGGGGFVPVDTAVTNSIAANVHYSVAAGNSNADACLTSPARVPRATTVAATTITDNRAGFSNFGACVDLFAPGQQIFSASHTAVNAYVNASGTSMASPHAAGTAALWRHKFPADNADQVHNALNVNATPGVVIGPGVGSPNLLLFSNMIPM